MKVYLLQYGEAKSEKEDPQRPLTDRDKTEVEAMARYVASCGVEAAEILQSGKLRAKHTAELFAQYLSLVEGVREQNRLAPLDGPHGAQELIQKTQRPLIVVEHLPHLSRLVFFLLRVLTIRKQSSSQWELWSALIEAMMPAQ